MSQLSKLVGFRSVSSSAGLWVNDLPGISTELGEALVEAEDTTTPGAMSGLAALWKRVSGLALDMLVLDLEVLLSEKGAFRHEIAYTTPMGVGTAVLTQNTPYAMRIKSQAMRFTRITLEEITVNASADGSVTVSVLQGGTALLEEDFELVRGMNVLDLKCEADNQRGQELRLFVVATVDITGFSGVVAPESDVCHAEMLSVLEAEADTPATDPYVDVSARVGGDLGQLVNRNALLLASAYQYACGYQFMLEKLSSDNFNVFTNTNRLVTEDNRDAYHKQYREFLKRGAALIAKQLENSRVMQSTPEETGGWTSVSLV